MSKELAGLTKEEMNHVCCNNCGGTDIEVMLVEWYALNCNGNLGLEPLVYKSYRDREIHCNNCGNLSKVITKREFAQQVNTLMQQINDNQDDKTCCAKCGGENVNEERHISVGLNTIAKISSCHIGYYCEDCCDATDII